MSADEADIATGDERARRRAVHGWCMYDWANSAFATSIGTAILPVYFVVLFKDAFGQSTTLLGFTFTGSSMWSVGVAVSTAIVALSSPVLGMIADRSQIKRTMLQIYTTGGAIFTVLGFFSAYSGEPWLFVLICYAIANIGFAGGIVFYNSLLPHIGEPGDLDRISSRGYAYGYVGGGLLLAIHLAATLTFSDTDQVDLVTRLAVASVGLWWLGWAQWTFRTVPEPRVAKPVDRLDPMTAASVAFSQVRQTLRELRRFRMLGLYLTAYLLFNDGIQTVLTIAGAFGPDTLGISLVSNMGTVLIVQFVAAGGAVMFGRAAGALGTKAALTIALGGLVLCDRDRSGVRAAGAGGARGLRLPARAHGRRRVRDRSRAGPVGRGRRQVVGQRLRPHPGGGVAGPIAGVVAGGGGADVGTVALRHLGAGRRARRHDGGRAESPGAADRREPAGLLAARAAGPGVEAAGHTGGHCSG